MMMLLLMLLLLMQRPVGRSPKQYSGIGVSGQADIES